MQCPKCGHNNPDDAKICELCSFDFKDLNSEQPKSKRRKFPILSVFFACIAPIFLVFIKPTFAFIAAFFCFCSTIASVIKAPKNRREKKLKLRTIVFAGIMLTFSSLFMLILSYWRIDAAPIPNDYTINDIRSAAPEYNQSYELLHSILDKNDNSQDKYAIGLSEEDLNNLLEIHDISKENDLQVISQKIKEKEQDILALWDKAKKGRDIFERLDSFPEIADLSEPYINIPYTKDLKELLYLYQNYICLQSINGNHEQAFNELSMLDSIFKKMSLNARSIIMKLICEACFKTDHFLLNFMIITSGL